MLQPLPGNSGFNQLDAFCFNPGQALPDSTHSQQAVFEYAIDLVCSIDRHDTFRYTNLSATKLLGYSQTDLFGMSVLQIVAPSDYGRFVREFDAARKNREPRSFELRLLRADKQELYSDWYVLHSGADGSLFCIVSDISEQKNAERLKQDFISMIKHDIRSPLLAIVQEISEGLAEDSPAAAKTELATCKKTTDRLIQLINDLLQFEELQVDKMKFELAPVFIDSVIERSIREIQALANSAGVNLKFNQVHCWALADEPRLIQLLINLLSNAIRYSPRDGTVLIEMRQLKGFIEIAVCDEGPGVAENLKDKIFMPFEQAPGSKETQSGGTGLGLAIAKLIVDGHRGEIGVRAGRNGGSNFWFTLHTHLYALR